jgi:hypothetical protein
LKKSGIGFFRGQIQIDGKDQFKNISNKNPVKKVREKLHKIGESTIPPRTICFGTIVSMDNCPMQELAKKFFVRGHLFSPP